MPRKPKHSGDNPTPDEDIIIEGTAEHIHDDSTAKAKDKAEANDHAKPEAPKRRSLGRALWVLFLCLGLLAALAAAGLAISNRLLITQQQQDTVAQDINTRTGNIETALAALEDEISDLRDALEQSQTAPSTSPDLLGDIPSRLSTLEDQITRLDGIITSWQDQFAKTPNPDADPDVMILARQLAEMEQRLLMLEGEAIEDGALEDEPLSRSGNPALQDQSEDTQPSASPPVGNTPAELSAITDAMITAARQGQEYADLLEKAVNTDLRWNALAPWAENPPPALEKLWQNLTAYSETVFITASSSDAAPAEDDSGWWSWLTSPFSDTIIIAPIDLGAEAKARFDAAIKNRDHMTAMAELKAWAGENDDITAWLAEWQRQFNHRQDLDDALTRLIMILDQ